MKFGVDFRRLNPELVAEIDGAENLTATLPQLSTGQAQAYGSFVYSKEPTAPIFDSLSLYAQDTWRMNKRLTLTYGVRWELVRPPYAAKGPEALTLDGLDNPKLPNNLRIAPSGTPLWETTYLNFAPRIGVSLRLFDKPGRELVIRGGGGMFYDLGLGRSAEGYGLEWPYTPSITYPIAGAGSPCPSPLTLPLPACALVLPVQGGPPTAGALRVMARDIVLPRTYQWNFAVEQSLGAKQSLTVSYVGAAGRKLLQSDTYSGLRLVGFSYPGTSTTTLVLGHNGGQSNYRALQLQYQRRLTQGLQAFVGYTFGESKDSESSDFSSDSIQPDAVPWTYRYGYSDFDVRHNFNAAVTYFIPSLKTNPFIEAITGDWGIDVRLAARSPLPLNPNVAAFSNAINSTAFLRPNQVRGQPFWVDDATAPGGRRVNLAAFNIPPVGELGNLPRNVVRGFNMRQIDLSLHRDFQLLEGVRLQLRADVFNITNTPNFSMGSGNVRFNAATLPNNFGAATGMVNRSAGELSSLYQSGGPRSMQFSARIAF